MSTRHERDDKERQIMDFLKEDLETHLADFRVVEELAGQRLRAVTLQQIDGQVDRFLEAAKGLIHRERLK